MSVLVVDNLYSIVGASAAVVTSSQRSYGPCGPLDEPHRDSASAMTGECFHRLLFC